MTTSANTSVRPTSAATDLALIAVFAGLIAAFALLPAIPLGGIGVPITLQTLAVALTGLVLGPKRGFLATLLYLAVGFAGLPVFAGGKAGLGVFAGPTIGYLLSFPLMAALAGFLAYRVLRSPRRMTWLWLAGCGVVASVTLNHTLGILGLVLIAHLDVGKAILGDLVFLPGDIAKNLAAGFIAAQVHRAFPALARR